MDQWGWEQLGPWLSLRLELPVGSLFCVIDGRTRGRPLSVRAALVSSCGVPHAVEMAREGVPLNIIQRQLGHANLGITSVYLEGIDNAEIIDAVNARREPIISASVGLRTLC